ncbi:MAG: hypothetical protein AAGD43_03220 [Pseudomonadota bacterium]
MTGWRAMAAEALGVRDDASTPPVSENMRGPTGPIGTKRADEQILVPNGPIGAGVISAEAQADEFEERAGIMQFDAGHSREEAERLAEIECGLSGKAEGGNDA